MVSVTERAKDELKTALSAHASTIEQGLRLVVTSAGQFGLGLDVERDGDEVVEYDGSKVLLVGNEVSPFVDGATIDIEDSLDGPRLTITKT